MKKKELENIIAQLKVETVLENFIEKIESPQMKRGNTHTINNCLASFGSVLIDNRKQGLETETFAKYKERAKEEYQEVIKIILKLINKNGYELGY